ncbi:PAS domain-containing sensor histidine kinase [Cohnella xylanilytica]|uniref:histidine kinase n=1 Tax=Cohnella xylanilytica TaxID=557555 RepID=A0A841TW52_9BACL|nr:ATP-binding protein [Cohnella xylanilytica]MBB6691232.1 HAMP domain-containing protein [Cohnella xylanilytica]GIO10998.1 PAS domain-containing sensor histidine kinase [Cohnella xylanilytica]
MHKFRFKLTALFLLLIGLTVLAAGILMSFSYKENHQNALKDHMVAEIRVLIAAAPWPAGQPESEQAAYLQSQAQRFKDLADMRITYIRPDGLVLGDSDHDPATMDNHSDRKEVKEALESGLGSSIRNSPTLGQNMLYVAMAVKDGDKTVGIVRLAVSLKDVERSLGNMWIALVSGLLILFVIAAAVSYRIARSVTRPLERMTSAAKRMANMDYEIRVPDAGRDEVSELARALNAMAASLQDQVDEIRQNEIRLQSVLDNMTSGVVMIGPDGRVKLYNRSAEQLLGSTTRERVGRSYSEAKQQYELLQLIREALQNHEPLHEELTVYYPEERLLEVNIVPMSMGEESGDPGLLLVLQDVTAIRRLERMRSEFVANVSHELKTPVAAVKGFAETLLAGAVNDPETAHSFLTIIHDESERLNRLIGDILELSKIESRRSPLQFSPVDVRAFLERLMEFMSTEATKKNIALDLQAEEELFVEADEDRLGQILLNLLQNGINYTPEGGTVRVKAEFVEGTDPEGGDDRVRITVSDTGIGIPKKDLPRIFERFYRVDKARSRSSGGTGLGLSIVKHLAELHHGSIRVESTVGVGSHFILELPLIQA